MPPRITQYLNKTILVSIPSLFEDGACRAYRLLGVEVQGLWLQSDKLIQRLASADTKDYESLAPVVFVPFGQIAGVMLATRSPELPAALAMRSGAPATRPQRKAAPPSPENRVKRKK
jgi:hypothetical protein